MKGSWRDAIGSVVQDLSSFRFESLVRDGRAGRCTEDELRRVIREYGRTLVGLPSEGFDLAEIYDVAGERDTWAIDVPLWTAEEGRSDLELRLTLREVDGEVLLSIDDVRVP